MSTHNPSDDKGPLQNEMFVIATAIDNTSDETQTGRLKVRKDGGEDNQGTQPDGNLQHVSCLVNGWSQNGQDGKFPASNYTNGSKLVMLNLGSQGYVVLGALGNNENDDSQRDHHHEASDHSLKPPADAGSPKHHPHSRKDEGKSPTEGPYDTPTAYRKRNGTFNRQLPKGDSYQKINDEVQTEPYGGRRKRRSGENKIPDGNEVGRAITDGTKDATEFIKKVGGKELIDNAFDMIKNLKQTAEQGTQKKFDEALGGMGNIMGALAGIASMLSGISQGTKEQDKKILKAWLYQIYKDETGKDALDLFGKETTQYMVWEVQYVIDHPGIVIESTPTS